LDFKDHLGVIKRQRRIILSFIGLAIILLLFLAVMAPRMYESEAILRIKQPTNIGVSLLKTNRAGNQLVVNQKLATYLGIIESRTVIEKVIKHIKWESFIKTKNNQKGIKDPKNNKPEYEAIKKRFIITTIKDTELIRIKVRAKQPKLAEIMVNTLVAVFIDRITNLTRSEQQMTRKFIATRLKYSKKQMDKAESIMTTFKSENKIVAPTIDLVKYVERIATIDKSLTENAIEMAIAKARLGNVERQVGSLKPEYMAENAQIKLYRSKLADLELRLVELTQRYGEKHPEIITCRAQIADLKNKLDLEIKRVITMDAASSNPLYQNLILGKLQAETAIAVATIRKQALDKVLVKEEERIAEFTAIEQELIRLMRDAAVAKDIYMMLAKRLEEARIAEAMQPTDIQIVDQAVVSRQSVRTKRWRMMLIVFWVNLFLGVGLAYTLDYCNKFIFTEADVKHYLDLPVLGNIPDFKCDDKK
jgi:succinoglycan biosynthesis transport protein ExoP